MTNLINYILLIILVLEFILKYLLTNSYLSLGVSAAIILSLILFSKHYRKTEMKLPWIYLAILIFALNCIVIDNNSNHYILNLLITFHAILLTLNWAESSVFVAKKDVKKSIDIGINRYSICFVTVLLSVYFAMSGKSNMGKAIHFDSLAFLLLGFDLLLLMTSYVINRFRNIQKSVSLIFSSTIVAVLILLISGPYVISTLTPNLLEIPKQNNRSTSAGTNSKVNSQRNNSQEVGYSNELNLSKTNNITKNHSPDAFLKLDSVDDQVFLKPGKIYLRGAGFDTYASNSWTNYYDNSQWFEDGVDNSADGVIRLQETSKNLHAIKHSVFLLNGEHGNIMALPNISEIYMDKILVEENETYYLPTATGNQVSYRLTSAYTTYEDIDKKNLVIGKKSKKYLSTLGEVSKKIKTTTDSIFKNETTDVEKIESILYYFRQNFHYSLVTKNTQDLDPLENFFYNEKSGHCELFATALVMMLRSAGIPSRICVGYCGGQFNKTLNAYIFYKDEAHAWAEIYFEGYGWVVIDSTPTGGPSVNNVENAGELEFDANKFLEVGPDTEKITKSKLSKGLIGVLEVLFISASKDPMLLINLILLTYPISFFFIFGLLKILRHEKRKQKDDIMSNLDFMKEIYRKFGQKQKGQTFLEYLEKLKKNNTIKDELDDILNYYYSINYGKINRNEEIENNILLELSKIKKPLKVEVSPKS